MAFFNFAGKTKKFGDLTSHVTVEALCEQLKILYREVNIIDENIIRIEDLNIDIWHEPKTFFVIEYRSRIPDFMEKFTDAEIINFCNDMNFKTLINCSFYRFDESVRVFHCKYPVFNIKHIRELNQLMIWFYQGVCAVFDDMEASFKNAEYKKEL